MIKPERKKNVNHLRVLKGLVAGGLCNECFFHDWKQCCRTKARGCIYPAFAQFQVIPFDKLQVDQHFTLLSTFTAVKIEKMQRISKGNDGSFNTIHSFNNDYNFLNNNNNCFNRNTYNTATVNYTTVDDRLEILRWLSPLEPQVRHRDIASRRVDSIGTWLLETEEFKRWRNGSREDRSYHPTLFCDGNPGVGKSYVV